MDPIACLAASGTTVVDGICDSDAECNVMPSLCVEATCPRPGADFCQYIPKPDGSPCEFGLACVSGVCCGLPDGGTP